MVFIRLRPSPFSAHFQSNFNPEKKALPRSQQPSVWLHTVQTFTTPSFQLLLRKETMNLFVCCASLILLLIVSTTAQRLRFYSPRYFNAFSHRRQGDILPPPSHSFPSPQPNPSDYSYLFNAGHDVDGKETLVMAAAAVPPQKSKSNHAYNQKCKYNSTHYLILMFTFLLQLHLTDFLSFSRRTLTG